jgi:RNA polymerase sigma-70 factor, ECF subfamily
MVWRMTETPPASPLQGDPDLPLVHQARAGDFAAFEALVGRYESRVYRMARRIVTESHDAEEVVQETFLSVLEHLSAFREESSFSTWVLRIATNAALKLLRKRREHKTVSLGGDDPNDPLPHPEFIAPWQEDPAELAQRGEIRQLLDEALGELEEKYRVVFVLRDLEELTTEETAESLKITPENVRIRLMRARLLLRERLTRTLGDMGRAAAAHRHD